MQRSRRFDSEGTRSLPASGAIPLFEQDLKGSFGRIDLSEFPIRLREMMEGEAFAIDRPSRHELVLAGNACHEPDLCSGDVHDGDAAIALRIGLGEGHLFAVRGDRRIGAFDQLANWRLRIGQISHRDVITGLECVNLCGRWSGRQQDKIRQKWDEQEASHKPESIRQPRCQCQEPPEGKK